MNDSIIAYKNQQSKRKCFFSYIRLWRVVLLRSGIMLRTVILPAAAVCEYNTTMCSIISLLRWQKYHAEGDSAYHLSFLSAFEIFLKVIK